MTGKYRGAVHCSCNINLKLTKNIPVIFHNLRGYDSHSLIKEINKFDVKKRHTKWTRKIHGFHRYYKSGFY